MITGAYILIALGGVLYLAGWVMLLVTAFRISIGWGLAVLFLSWLVVPLVIFLVMYWAEARGGFFIMLSGIISLGLGGFVWLGSVATSATAEFENFEPAPVRTIGPMVLEGPDEPQIPTPSPEPGAEYESSLWPTPSPVVERPEELDTIEAEPTRPPTAVGQTGMGNRIEWARLAGVDDLAAHLGELIELRLKDGEVLRVTLSAVADDALYVNQRVGGGSMSYSVRRELIDEIFVQR